MKEKISLVLAIVMIIGALAGLSAFAEAGVETAPETEVSYDGLKIAYSNINYTDELYMMFAVPVIADLPATHKIQLLTWANIADGDAFSYLDVLSNKIEREEKTANIGGVEHYVFKYAISAEMMTDTICARPVVVTENKGKLTPVAYGKLVDYSVVEYVKAAKGEFDGIPALTNSDHIALLDAMLDFGAMAQVYFGGGEAYGEFLANDDLHKIWVTPIIGGVERDPVFSGFFKYEADKTIEVYPPHYDGLDVIAAYDSTGAAIEGFEEGSPLDVDLIDGDISLKIKYDTQVIRQINIEALGVGAMANTVMLNAVGGNNIATWSSVTSVGLGNKTTANFSAISTEDGGKDGSAQRLYHGIKVIADPNDPTNAYLQWTATDYSVIQFTGLGGNDYSSTGFGDTVYPSITIELKVAKVNGKMMNTGFYYMRHRLTGSAAGVDDVNNYLAFPTINIFKFKENGDVIVRGTKVDDEGKAEELVIGTVADEGFTRVAIVIDTRTEMYHCYVSDENDNMQYVLSTPVFYDRGERWDLYRAKHQANLADDNPANDEALIAYESLENWFKYATLENAIGGSTSWKAEYNDAVVEIGGVSVPVKDAATGKYNLAALQLKAEEECSLLFDDYRIVIGDVYGSTYD